VQHFSKTANTAQFLVLYIIFLQYQAFTLTPHDFSQKRSKTAVFTIFKNKTDSVISQPKVNWVYKHITTLLRVLDNNGLHVLTTFHPWPQTRMKHTHQHNVCTTSSASKMLLTSKCNDLWKQVNVHACLWHSDCFKLVWKVQNQTMIRVNTRPICTGHMYGHVLAHMYMSAHTHVWPIHTGRANDPQTVYKPSSDVQFTSVDNTRQFY